MTGFRNKGKVNKGNIVDQMNANLDDLRQLVQKRFNDVSRHQVARHGHKVTAEDVAKGAAEIKVFSSEKITGHIIQIYRAGSIVTTDARVYVGDKGILFIQNGLESYTLAEGDIIAYLCW